MKKLLAVLFVSFLLLGATACSDDKSSDESEEEESSGSASEPAEEEEDDEDASASASEPAEEEEEEEEEEDASGSASEPAEEDLPSGMDSAVESFDETFDLTDDEEECLVDAALDDPDLLELDETEIETDPEAFNLVFGLLRDCVGDERLAEALAEEIAGTTGLDEAQTQCVAAEFVELDEAVWGELIQGSNDPSYVPSTEVTTALLDMFTTCGIDPTTLGG